MVFHCIFLEKKAIIITSIELRNVILIICNMIFLSFFSFFFEINLSIEFNYFHLRSDAQRKFLADVFCLKRYEVKSCHICCVVVL